MQASPLPKFRGHVVKKMSITKCYQQPEPHRLCVAHVVVTFVRFDSRGDGEAERGGRKNAHPVCNTALTTMLNVWSRLSPRAACTYRAPPQTLLLL